ncbi:MAG TPA: PDZ domain-containing protein [Phycisphaerae bacterium]|jgi:C-terminal processing protease CtpA/Prc
MSLSWTRCFTAGVVLLGMEARAQLQTAPPQNATAPPAAVSGAEAPNPETIFKLVTQLGSPQFDERLAASKALRAYGPSAFETLKAAYRATDDLEIRLRIREIVEKSFSAAQIRGQSGFLGIKLMPTNSALDPRIPVGQGGILVQEVVADHAAQRAGMKAGDVIVALDGSALEEPNDPNGGKFREQIRTTTPGTSRRITVLRIDGGVSRQITMEVTLGERPIDQYQFGELDEVRRKFVDFWSTQFSDEDEAVGPASRPQRIELEPVAPPSDEPPRLSP